MSDAQPPANGRGWQHKVAPVERDATAAQATYDRLASIYDMVEAPFERKGRAAGLRLLAPRAGERIVEVGPGTGQTLVTLAQQVGPRGLVVGVDLSIRMAARAGKRLRHAGHAALAAVVQGDARRLPVADRKVDAVTMSFVLDLISAEEIPPVLAECRRVLRPDGRLAIVALQQAEPRPVMARLYGWAHHRMPRLLDCRPIPVGDLLADTGWRIDSAQHLSMWGIPVSATVTRPSG